MTAAPMLVVRSLEAAVRPVRLRLPFRFGAITLTACPQLFVRADVEVQGHDSARGWAAEMMVPKWFDKRAGRTPEQNVHDLSEAVERTAAAYVGDRPATAFGLHARHHAALMAAGAAGGATALSSAYGAAVIDRAVLDALCRACGTSFVDAAQRNLVGLGPTALLPDLAGFDWSAWLAGRRPLARIALRHTVGLLDELDALRYDAAGLPVTLRAVLRTQRPRWFKLKLGGDPDADLRRLAAILEVLGHEARDWQYTVDGNEQYADAEALRALDAGLARLPRPPIYLEQPLPRESSLDRPLPAGLTTPLLIDEADGDFDSFLAARDCGWTGVSSKACKGVYKALANRARIDAWNLAEGGTRWFMSAEDLTCQAGLAVQQDLALVALLGLAHGERNGHHYGDGFGNAPAAEQRAFAAAHPDLYAGTPPRLAVHDGGELHVGSLLACTGYAHAADPDPRALQPLRDAATML